ncbi:MAG: LapA family protein [Crocinitomicaceae bacterium]
MTTERTTFQKAKLITGLILLILALTVIIQNLDPVKVEILFWEVEVSLFVLTSLNLIVGFLLGTLFITKRNKKIARASLPDDVKIES